MSLLAGCPGGTLLEPPIAEVVDTDLLPFANGLIDGLTVPQTEVFEDPARFRMLAAGRRFGKTHLSLVQLIVWGAQKAGSAELVSGPYLSGRQVDRMAPAKGNGAARIIR